MRSAHGAEIKVAFLGLMIASSSALSLSVRANDAAGMRPVADAGLSQYAAQDPVQLDGTGSYDPDGSGTLTYSWRQIAGPSTVISDAGTATPTISGFMQTDEIR